ncbi:MAG TPA: CPBP family intramembrane glutamic endopeptidase [Parvularculaceae bacterium]|nr:CPBP family intramembrane glutamic endopeptidase [Parvularculaceae bacterium]
MSRQVRRLPILVCLGLMLVYPVFSTHVQGSTVTLAPRFGEINARLITEGAIWLYGAIVLGVALLWERRTLASIGLRRPTFGAALWGVAAAIALLVLSGLASFVTYNVLHQANHTAAQIEALVRGSLVYAFFLALRGGVIEEIFFRGLAIEQLTLLTGRRWVAALSATLLFIFVHALRFDLRQLIPIATASFGFMALYLWRRNLLVNIIAHFLIDALALGAVAVHATSLY